LAVVKPPNLPVQADRSGDPDLLSLLKQDLKLRHHKPGQVFLGLVHRLDRPVGGVMVFGKTSKAASRISEQIRAGHFGKIYIALVHGVPEPDHATLEHVLRKDERTNRVTVVPAGTRGGKTARLAYTTIATEPGPVSRLRIELFTGRPHQIRVQLATIGYPLVGDAKYGPTTGDTTDIKLWSAEIRCPHPTQDQQMVFAAPPPW
jgi:23S rRNA pseudouridine1911/1915/1917 synthase